MNDLRDLEDRVRDATHEYASHIEPPPDAWDRLARRTRAAGRRVRAVRIGGTIVVAAALVAGVLLVADHDSTRRVETPPAAPGTTANQPPTTVPLIVNGWPDLTENVAGVYSWDGTTDEPGSNEGFMHNGYGSGDVTIRIASTSAPVNKEDATGATVAGHDATYRRIDAQREQWVADIEGTTVVIGLDTRPGTSETDLAEAHAVIESMRTEPMSNPLGFRLLFTLTTDDWDSG